MCDKIGVYVLNIAASILAAVVNIEKDGFSVGSRQADDRDCNACFVRGQIRPLE